MNLKIIIKSTKNWGTTGLGSMEVINKGNQTINGWSFLINTQDFTITEIWNFNYLNKTVSSKNNSGSITSIIILIPMAPSCSEIFSATLTNSAF